MNIKAFSVNCLTDKRWRLSRELRMYIGSVVKEIPLGNNNWKMPWNCYNIQSQHVT